MEQSRPLRIALIYPIDNQGFPSNNVPLGLASIAAVARQKGCEVKGYVKQTSRKSLTDEQLLRMVSDFHPDLIGFSLLDGTSVQNFYRLSEKFSAALNVPLIAGGPHVTAQPREPLDYHFSVTVNGEGEDTFSELVDHYQHGKDLNEINGIAFRAEDGSIVETPPRSLSANLDDLPHAAVDVFDDCGLETRAFGGIMGSRGCPYQCTFCFQGVFTHKYRMRSPENIIDEMLQRMRRYGVTRFIFWDDLMMIDKKRLHKICDLIRTSPELQNCTWEVQGGRLDLADQDLLANMARSGCDLIDYGIESGDNDVLKELKKVLTVDRIYKVVKWTHDAGIEVGGNMMYGFPTETLANLENTHKLIRDLDSYVTWWTWAGVLIPHAGTEIYSRYHKEYGFTNWWTNEKYGGHPHYPLYSKMRFFSDTTLQKNFFRYSPETKKKIRAILMDVGKHNFRHRYHMPERLIHYFFARVSILLGDHPILQEPLEVLYRFAFGAYRQLYRIKKLLFPEKRPVSTGYQPDEEKSHITFPHLSVQALTNPNAKRAFK